MMLKRGRICRNQRGITGLETAIILIAFVVVASVFAYTALSAGLFSAQKSKEAIHSGLAEASSTMEVRGDVVGYLANVSGNQCVGKVEVTLSLVSGGEPVDMKARWSATGTYVGGNEAIVDAGSSAAGPLLVSFNDREVRVSQCVWTVTWVSGNDGDNLLEDNEKAVITVWLQNPGGGTWTADGDPYLGTSYLQTDEEFTMEIKPAQGATLTIERTTPSALDTVMDYH